MKTILFTFLVTLTFSLSSYSQSCSTLINEVKNNGSLSQSINCSGSSALSSAAYYTYNGSGYVVIYFTSSSSPYIYCGISSGTWKNFVNGGRSSWGKSFDNYISNYGCNCR